MWWTKIFLLILSFIFSFDVIIQLFLFMLSFKFSYWWDKPNFTIFSDFHDFIFFDFHNFIFFFSSDFQFSILTIFKFWIFTILFFLFRFSQSYFFSVLIFRFHFSQFLNFWRSQFDFFVVSIFIFQLWAFQHFSFGKPITRTLLNPDTREICRAKSISNLNILRKKHLSTSAVCLCAMRITGSFSPIISMRTRTLDSPINC